MITFSELGMPWWGRLGNQMYEYAALLGIADELGFDIAIPPSPQHDLASCFNATAPILTERDLRAISSDFHEPLLRYSTAYRDIEDGTDLTGYFQSPLYFPDRQVVLNEFAFHPHLITDARSVLSPLEQRGLTTVGVTVRRGDYLSNPDQYLPLCDTDFYDLAIEHIATRAQRQPVFLIASDDPAWCRSRFRGDQFVVVASLDYPVQMALLTMCDHAVIANSSFAWWAAWLNQSDGMRVAPSRWWGTDCDYPDRDRDPLPSGWTEVDARTVVGDTPR